MTKNLTQQLTEELTAQTARAERLVKREQKLRQIIDELFQLAEPGNVKNALWKVYQSLDTAEESEVPEYTLYWHLSEMYTARLAYGNETPLWGSERLEVKQGDRWIPGKVGHLVPGGGLVLFPRKGTSDQEYITLTVGSVVGNVSGPVGDGGGPEQ